LTVTEPNQFTHSDILAARELMIEMMHPAFANDIRAGKLDGTGMHKRAEAMLIQRRKDEEEAGD
jgi:hypothetical protein